MLRPPPERVKHRPLQQPRYSLPQCQNQIAKCGHILLVRIVYFIFTQSIDPYPK